TAPNSADASPAQYTRAVPYAAVTYSTPKIAMSENDGGRQRPICSTAPPHASPSARPGDQRRIPSARLNITAISTDASSSAGAPSTVVDPIVALMTSISTATAIRKNTAATEASTTIW